MHVRIFTYISDGFHIAGFTAQRNGLRLYKGTDRHFRFGLDQFELEHPQGDFQRAAQKEFEQFRSQV